MASVKIYREEELLLDMQTVQNISFDIEGNVMDIPIPDMEEAMIMNLGGVSRNIKINWDTISNDLAADIGKLAFDIMDGTMFNSFIINIEDWGLSKDCVISNISINQRAGEPKKYSVSISIILGEVI
jgi:hypothetical protein